MGSCGTAQASGSVPGEGGMWGEGLGGGLKRPGTCVYLRLSHIVAQQKPTQQSSCPPIKINLKFFKFTINFKKEKKAINMSTVYESKNETLGQVAGSEVRVRV